MVLVTNKEQRAIFVPSLEVRSSRAEVRGRPDLLRWDAGPLAKGHPLYRTDQVIYKKYALLIIIFWNKYSSNSELPYFSGLVLE